MSLKFCNVYQQFSLLYERMCQLLHLVQSFLNCLCLPTGRQVLIIRTGKLFSGWLPASRSSLFPGNQKDLKLKIMLTPKKHFSCLHDQSVHQHALTCTRGLWPRVGGEVTWGVGWFV